jgi:hypothetical protein
MGAERSYGALPVKTIIGTPAVTTACVNCSLLFREPLPGRPHNSSQIYKTLLSPLVPSQSPLIPNIITMEPVSTLTFLFLFFLSLFNATIAAPTTPDIQAIATGPSPDPLIAFSTGVAVEDFSSDETSSRTAWGNGVKLHYCKHPDWVKCLKYASANENTCYNTDWMWNDS